MGFPSTLEDIINRRIDNLFQTELPDAQLLTRSELKEIITRLSVKVESAIKLGDPELFSLCEQFEHDRQEAQKRVEPLEAQVRQLQSDLRLEVEKTAELISVKAKMLANVQKLETTLRGSRLNEIKARSRAEMLERELAVQKSKSNRLSDELKGLEASVMRGLVDKRID
jgi:hypothetical protein